jgi:hypothetical protein
VTDVVFLTVLYVLVFLVTSGVFLLALLFGFRKCIRHFGLGIRLKARARRVLLWTVLAISFTTAFPATYRLLHDIFDYYPPFLSRPPEIKILSTGDDLRSLEAEAARTRTTLANIDDLTLSQLKKELSNTLSFVETLREEAAAQQAVLQLRSAPRPVRRKDALRSAEKHAKITGKKSHEVRYITLAVDSLSTGV